MTAEQFIEDACKKATEDYGMCPPPTEAQAGLNILIEHFLGKDWYSTMSMSTQQVNTQAIYEILDKYPEKKTIKEHIKNFLKKKG